LKHLITDPERLRYFEENLDANEPGVALLALCDFLLESFAPKASSVELREIESLQETFKIDDDCIRRLLEKGPSRMP
jgi:hypothetical protein